MSSPRVLAQQRRLAIAIVIGGIAFVLAATSIAYRAYHGIGRHQCDCEVTT